MSGDSKKMKTRKSEVLLVFVVLVFMAAFSHKNTAGLVENVQATDKTYSEIEKVDDLVSILRATEAHNNAYVLLGKQRYLEIYRQDIGLVHQRLSSVKNVLQRLNFEPLPSNLENLVNQKIADMDEAASNRESSDLNTALQVFLTGNWQRLSEEIQKVIEEIRDRQKQLLANAAKKQDVSIEKNENAVFYDALGCVVIFLAYLSAVRRQKPRELERQTESKVA